MEKRGGRTWRERLLLFVAGQAEGDSSPEEAGAHLHREMALVVCVPDPDVAAILYHPGIGGGLHAQGFESSEAGLDLLAAFHFHGDHDGVGRVGHGQGEGFAQLHGLRRCVEDAGEQIGEAAIDRRLDMLGLPV